MNETTALWLVIIATLIFTIAMIFYNFKNLFNHAKSVQGVAFGLDNIRYTIMFISFVSTLYLLIKAGGIFLSEYKLTTLQTTLSFFGVIALSVFTSLIISSMIVNAERTFGEGGLTIKKKIAVGIIYLIVASLDFSTISLGYGMVSNGLESKKITKLETKRDEKASFIIDNKKDIGLGIKEELQEVQRQIQNIGSTQPKFTKRVRTLNATLKRCEKKHKPCPDTHAELARITTEQRNKKLERLVKQRNTLREKLLEITNSFENTTEKIKAEKLKALQSIKDESEENKSTARTVAFLMLLLAFTISVLSTILKDDDEEIEEVYEEEVIEESTAMSIEDRHKREYVLRAMMLLAEQNEMHLEEANISHAGLRLNFGRDTVKDVAKALAKKDEKSFAIGSKNLTELIAELQGPDTLFRQWLAKQRWNNKAVHGALDIEQGRGQEVA